MKETVPVEQQQELASHLFTLRVWSENQGDGQVEWRGKLRHVLSGDVRYFQDWAALIPVLLTMLREVEK